MQISEVSICNQALSWLGGKPITSLDDDDREAGLCKANYTLLRDAVLQEGTWSFSRGRKRLTPEVDPPEWGYNYQFTVPPDVLRIIEVRRSPDQGMDREPWELEGNTILANRAELYVLWQVRVINPNHFSPMFVQALAARIATDIAIPLTSSRELQANMQALYDRKLLDALNIDGTQGRQQRLHSSGLRDVRHVPANRSRP